MINFEGQCREHEDDGDIFTYALIGQQNTDGTIMYHKGGDGILMELRAWPFIAVTLGIIIVLLCMKVKCACVQRDRSTIKIAMQCIFTYQQASFDTKSRGGGVRVI